MPVKTYRVPKGHQLKTVVNNDTVLLLGGQSVELDELVGNGLVRQSLLETESMYKARVASEENMRLANQEVENARAEVAALRSKALRESSNLASAETRDSAVKLDTSSAAAKIRQQQKEDAVIAEEKSAKDSAKAKAKAQ